MKEIQDILRAYDKARSEGKQSALATVVHVQGSSYRRPGARMLVTEDGKLTGAISGGCLEGDALRKALLVMSQQKPMVVTYDTTDDDDAKLGVGLGCNGIIQILIEPLLPGNNNNAIKLLQALVKEKTTGVIVTMFSLTEKRSAQQGTVMLVMQEKVFSNNIVSEGLHAHLLHDATCALETNTSTIKTYSSNATFTSFIEVVKPATTLVVIGAGNDAIPLVNMAAILGWNVTVVDGRPNYATSDRFPLATNIIVTKADNLLSQVQLNEQSAVVLMTHNYNYDLAALKQLLLAGVQYIGSLGPKKKLQRMVEELKEQGLILTEQHLQTVYGPVGLDIGAETAEEIALSIIAEIKAVVSNRPATHLRERQIPIHVSSPVVS